MSTNKHTSSFTGHLSAREAANAELAIRAARGMFTLRGASGRWFVVSWLCALAVGAVLYVSAPASAPSGLSPAHGPTGTRLTGPAFSVPMPQPGGTVRRKRIGLVAGQPLPAGAKKLPGRAPAYAVARPFLGRLNGIGRRFLLPLLAGAFALAVGLSLARRKPKGRVDEELYPGFAGVDAVDVLDGMPLGAREADGFAMNVPRESLRTHLLILGATGTGKTFSIIRPLLRHSGTQWKGVGLVAFDYTGNLPLEDEGLFDYILDPSALAAGGKSHRWNGFADRNVEVLLQGLFPREETDQQKPYWATNNNTIVRTLHLAIHTLNETPTARMMHSYVTDQREMIELRDRYASVVRDQPSDTGHKEALLNLRQMCELQSSKFKDIMGGVSGVLSEVSSGVFGEIGSTSDFDLAEALIGGKRIGVRLKKADMPAGLRYARLFLGTLQSTALSLSEADHLRCLLVIDEYPKYRTSLSDFLTIARQYGVGIVLAAQTVSHLHELSGQKAGVYTTNSRSLMVMAPTAGDDARFWQAEFGDQVVTEESTRVSRRPGGTQGLVAGPRVSVDTTFREVERPIIPARELQSRNQRIVFRLHHNRLNDRAVWVDPDDKTGRERRFSARARRAATRRIAALEAARMQEAETSLAALRDKAPVVAAPPAVGVLVDPSDGSPLDTSGRHEKERALRDETKRRAAAAQAARAAEAAREDALAEAARANDQAYEDALAEAAYVNDEAHEDTRAQATYEPVEAYGDALIEAAHARAEDVGAAPSPDNNTQPPEVLPWPPN